MDKKIVGMKQSIKAIESKNAEVVYIARDIDDKLKNRIEKLCNANSINVIYADSMKELGVQFGIDVSASVACILK